MEIHVNGKTLELAGPASIRTLVEQYGLGTAACAVEVNQSLIPRREHERHELREGDVVEIVTLVGGG